MDQHHGQGGTYLFDPETGERVLLERTEPPQPAAAPAPEPPPEPASVPQYGRRRARGDRGRFRGDDTSTPDVNEAWQ